VYLHQIRLIFQLINKSKEKNEIWNCREDRISLAFQGKASKQAAHAVNRDK